LRDRKVTVRLEESWCASSSSLPLFAGNKKWKLQHWIQRDDYPVGSFLVSHGGYQSNAMLALAQLARMKRMGFVYYTKSLPSSAEPASGNLKHALELGMQVVSLSTAKYDCLFASNEEQPHAAQGTPHPPPADEPRRSSFSGQSAGGLPSVPRRAPSSSHKAQPAHKPRSVSSRTLFFLADP
jgi:hypothetical protein